MARLDRGWFELVNSDAVPGTRYQFIIEGQPAVPDPASRYQPSGVHGASEVIDPAAYVWRDGDWRGRPWDEAVIYELHVGTFSPEGTYAGAEKRLDYLADLGVTAIELMPLASFPGERNWGYDGVLPYAPANAYGRPEDLKRFIEAAHTRDLMVFLDVVYNHFGPEGNYLWLYAPQFFTDRHHTPWGQAINFDGAESRPVRDYFIHNALYWLEEYHFDGLRLDAVNAIVDNSRPHILIELAETVRGRFAGERQILLVLENDRNEARYLRRDAQGSGAGGRARWYDAQWNDDIHHALHILLTEETNAYYSDYSKDPIGHLGRCLAEGFGYQGEVSEFRKGELRGEVSRDLPPTSFVTFLQNHDQAGNRALGERIGELADPEALKVAMAILLLAPSPPLLFMGEEFGAATPFLFFCDFGAELAAKVSAGRRAEFPHFNEFDSEGHNRIPDPNDAETFLRCKLDWASVDRAPHRAWLEFYRSLLACRRTEIVPRIKNIAVGRAEVEIASSSAIRVHWPFVQGGGLELRANFSRVAARYHRPSEGRLIYSTSAVYEHSDEMPPLSAAWLLT